MPDLRVLTNIPNPYNGALYESLNDIGCDTEVLYKTKPAGEGRTWDVPLQPNERITSRRDDVRALLRDPAEHTILSGGYHRQRDLLRLTTAAASKTNLIFWGERLRPEGTTTRDRRAREVLFRPFSCILAIGSWARESYERVTYGRIPVHTFPYGLPAPTHRPERADEPVVGYAGALIERKGVDDLLRAVADTRARPRIEVVGSGPLQHALQQMAKELRLDVTWHGEVITNQLNAIRSRWWAQVVPSHYDGWGMVVPEALAAGVPVIAGTEVGAARDLVLSGVTGELTHSTSEIAASIDRVLNPNHQHHLATAAQVLGAELVADRAAAWLVDLFKEGPGGRRSFIDHALARARAAGLAGAVGS